MPALLPLAVTACLLAMLVPHPIIPLLVLYLGIALCAGGAWIMRHHRWAHAGCVVLACWCCGLGVHPTSGTHHEAYAQADTQAKEQAFLCACSGTIDRVYTTAYAQRLRMRVEDAHFPPRNQFPAGLRKLSVSVPLSPVLRIGDRIEVRGLCRGAQGAYGYRWSLSAQRITAIHQRENGSRAVVWRFIDSLKREHSVATALILGMASYPDQHRFRAAGIAHMLAVSGLHVGIVCVLCMMLLRFFGCPWYIRHGVVALVVLGYMWLTGMSLPTQRAAIMVIILGLSQLLGRHIKPYAALSAAALIVVCLHPQDVYSVGFQLSFVAVVGIMHLGMILRNLRIHYRSLMPWTLDRPLWRCVLWLARSTCDALCIGIAASLAVTPLIVWYFQVLNPWSPIATILVTPVVIIIIGGACAYVLLESLWAGGPWTISTIIVQSALDLLAVLSDHIGRWHGSQIIIADHISTWYIFFIWPLMIALGWCINTRLARHQQQRIEMELKVL